MSAAKPTASKDTDPPKKQRVFPTDFAQFVAATAAGLGDGWAVDADSKPHSGLSAYLAHPDGRRIGIKHIWRGEGVQTWALDVPTRELERTGDAEAHANSVKHLTPGVRYNVGVCFTNSSPAATTARNIRTRLLPAFDGKRPSLRAFSKKRPRRTAGAEGSTAVAGETTSSDTTRAADQAQPKKAAAKTTAAKKAPRRATKKAQPSRQAAESKKQPAAPRARRATTTAAKTTKAKGAKARQEPQPAESPTSN
ncbi:hypothetical protein [Streptomyces sp. BRA346]|uniref:hypothetical protein n=1 Tax=Streptomyces sp. BRA346 TaxID=2878199 RepID=UPI0040631CB2